MISGTRPLVDAAEDAAREVLYRFLAAVVNGPHARGWDRAIDARSGALVRLAEELLHAPPGADATPDEPHPYLDRLVGPFVSLVAEGQARGEFRDDHDAAFLAQMAVGTLNSAITSWLADPEYPVEAGLAEAADYALETLRASPEARTRKS